MKYQKYKPGQRVFFMRNGVLLKGCISSSKKYKKGQDYLICRVHRFDEKFENIGPYHVYVHAAYIASFNDKKTFCGLVRRYQDHLMKECRKIDTHIRQLNQSKCDLIDGYDQAERLAW